jgi:acylglycerol lipase
LDFCCRYAGKPRLGTVIELLRVTASLEKRLKDVNLPFLVLHGDADVVTEPAVSSFLYESAKSEDKTIRIYEGMLHSLIQGEPDDNVAIILEDISSWLKQRVEQHKPEQS